jgi:hypothetical protein
MEFPLHEPTLEGPHMDIRAVQEELESIGLSPRRAQAALLRLM